MSKFRAERYDGDIDIECCDHCHGEPRDCPDYKPGQKIEEPLSVDVLVEFLAGRLTKADLTRMVLRARPQEVLPL